MECKIHLGLLSEFAKASADFFAATSKLFQVAGLQNDGLSFSDAYKKAKRKHDRCKRAHDAIKRHRSTHRCSRTVLKLDTTK